MNSDGNKPLCPHCFRESCPWLGAYKAWWVDGTKSPAAEQCPHAGHPLPPGSRIFLRSKLLKTFTSSQSFVIQGRGTVHTTTSPAGEPLPQPGEAVLFNGEEVKVLAVEAWALSAAELARRDTPIGLLLKED
jgi:hypothetical protein